MAQTYLSRDRLVPLAAVLLVSAVLGAIVYWSALEYENERAGARLERDFLKHAAAIVREFTANAEVLYAIRSIHESSDGLTREEFRRIATDAVSRHPAIHALEWSPRVPGELRAEHEERARREGLDAYRITESPRPGEFVEASPRDEYFPVYSVVPDFGNEAAVGFDLASEPTRRGALVRAMDTGDLSLTDPLDLVQVPATNDAALAFVPVFGAPTGTASSRRETLRGFVLAVFCFDDVLEKALDDSGAREPFHIQLLDEDVGGEPRMLYASTGAVSKSSSGRSLQKKIEFGGQRWLLVGEPMPAYLQAQRTYQPAALGIGVFLIAPLLVGFLLARIERSHGAILRRNVQILRSILASLSEGVIVANKAGRFILANEAARDFVGEAPEYLPPADWARTFGLHLPDGKTLYPAEELPLSRAIRGVDTTEAEVVVRNSVLPSPRWLSVNGSPLVDEKGTVRGGVVIFRDITSHKQAEEHLLRLSNAVEQTADAVFITNCDGTIEYANPAFEAVTGYAPDEVVGGNPNILSSGRQGAPFYQEMWNTILDGQVFRAPIVNRKKNDELFDAEITISPIRDSGGRLTHFVSVMKDVTERKRMLEQDFEMRIASSVQQRLYPQAPPAVADFDIDGIVVPADATCGDYFDYVQMPGATLGLVIGDVSGHGFGPALVMAETRSYIRMVAQSVGAPAEILLRTNGLLAEDLEDHRYVTMLFARLDLANGCLIFANAGQAPGHVLDRNGKVKQQLGPTGPPLGMFGDAAYTAGREVVLEPGELLVLLTDGVIEAEQRDGEFFGIDRALDVVAAHRDKPAREIADHVQRAVRVFTGTDSLRDDLTIVVCKRETAN